MVYVLWDKYILYKKGNFYWFITGKRQPKKGGEPTDLPEDRVIYWKEKWKFPNVARINIDDLKKLLKK